MHTERLIIRPFTADDAEAYWPLVSHPDLLRYTGESAAQSLDQARDILLTRPLRDYATHGFGRMACIEKTSGRLIGFSGLNSLKTCRKSISVIAFCLSTGAGVMRRKVAWQ